MQYFFHSGTAHMIVAPLADRLAISCVSSFGSLEWRFIFSLCLECSQTLSFAFTLVVAVYFFRPSLPLSIVSLSSWS